MLLQGNDEIGVLYCYARTGATLVNQILGCNPDNLVISEVNPTLGYDSPIQQAKQWYGYDGPMTAEAMYIEQIIEIKKFAVKNNKNLVIRDWSYVDFQGFPFVTPTYKSTQQEELGLNFRLNECAMVRHPFDVFVSVNKIESTNGMLPMQSFVKGYDAYTKFAHEVGYIRYEDLCQDPVNTAETLALLLKADIEPDFLTKFSSFKNYRGWVHQPKSGIEAKKVERIKIGLPKYQRILERLGYDD